MRQKKNRKKYCRFNFIDVIGSGSRIITSANPHSWWRGQRLGFHVPVLPTKGSCVKHCGLWIPRKDITLVITSVVQVILLPECRTIRGFLSVIQREWIDAGHPFSDRYRNGPWSPKNQKTSSDGSSFFLFLHAINHLIATYPSHFQFNRYKLYRIVSFYFIY